MFEQVKNAIVETINCSADAVTMEANLSDDLGMDSLDAVQLNMLIEEQLGVAIPDEELTELKTVADVVNCVEKLAK